MKYSELQYDAEIGVLNTLTLQCKGGGGGSSTTKPSREQRAILDKQLKLAEGLEAKGDLNFFGPNTLASGDPLQGIGQQGQLGAAQGLQGMQGDLISAQRRGLNADLVNDPRTEAAAQAATRGQYQGFNEQVLPGISSAASAQGAFGGDRANVLRAQAGRDLMQSVGDTRAQVFSNALNAGTQAQQNAIGLQGQLAQGILAPGQIAEGIGNTRQAGEQSQIDADRERFEFGEFAATDTANRVNSLLSGINYGSTTKSSGGGK